MLEALGDATGGRYWLYVLVPAVIFVALLPTLVAVALRRKDWRRILAFNVVAALSWPAWVATLVWAATGVQKEGAAREPGRLQSWFWPSLVLLLVAGYVGYQFFQGG
jgi:membrane protease YdiL (CAAX protease family)